MPINLTPKAAPPKHPVVDLSKQDMIPGVAEVVRSICSLTGHQLDHVQEIHIRPFSFSVIVQDKHPESGHKYVVKDPESPMYGELAITEYVYPYSWPPVEDPA
jgi:hypothetical protein